MFPQCFDRQTMRPLIALLAGVFLLSVLPSRAADESAVQKETQGLFQKINEKLKSGARSEKELAPELKELDELYAKYEKDKSGAGAEVLLLKAALYLQVFDDTPKAAKILKKVKADYPGTPAAGRVDQILASLEKREAAQKVQDSLVGGTEFPNFEVTDLDGKPLSVSAQKGKVVLIDFWATWCGPCVQELPNVLAAYEKYHDKGFNVIGISLDQKKDALTDFIEQRKIPWPQFFDGKGWGNELAQKYGINSIPATYLLDKDGKILAKGLRGEALDEAIAKALK
jgi:thiol-disulfide isomerase/thioredoxin